MAESNRIVEALKEKWESYDSGKQRKIVMGAVITLVVVLSLAGYYSSRGDKPVRVQKTSPKQTIALDTDAMERGLYSKAQKAMEDQDRKINEIRKDLDLLKQTGVPVNPDLKPSGDGPIAGSVVNPDDLPMPPAKDKRSSGAKRDITPPPPFNTGAKTGTRTPSKSDAIGVTPPPPPILGRTGDSEITPPPTPSPSVIGSISIVSQKAEEGKPGGDDSKKNSPTLYLPPSILPATLITGLDAPALGDAKKNPIPVLFRLREMGILPNSLKSNVKGCFCVGEGEGSLSDERVHIRVVGLACISNDGKAVIDQAVSGFTIDEDGKVGLKGNVVAKLGSSLARSVLAGFFGGVGSAMQAASSTVTNTTSGATQIITDTDMQNLARSGVGGGISEGAKDLQKFYLKLAEASLPVIEVGSTKPVTIVIKEGVELKIKEQSVQVAYPTN